ncbi:hypothetical protein CFC21_024315 [Triticum aestivum]|uniref:Uncharacterized protein n=2 Tax=Triticum aestivum TaxID=4565 RepID=A0A9R1JAC5_WHEAT|nr:hypothetical protein CFC21_024314 [Triticum aestivum]KAF7009819.1 hypothetical protein CFC21_024315 [Triticum aestivum]
MVLCLGSWDHARQMGSNSAASPPELQIHDSSIEEEKNCIQRLRNGNGWVTSQEQMTGMVSALGHESHGSHDTVFLWCMYLVQIRRRQAKSCCFFFFRFYYGYKQLLFRSSPETTAQIHLFSTMPTWWSGALTTCEGLHSRC